MNLQDLAIDWISVNNRLPDNQTSSVALMCLSADYSETELLISDWDKVEVRVNEFTGEVICRLHYRAGAGMTTLTVTHWMPLCNEIQISH